MKNDPNKGKELAYYLTLFKIEGHKTWRADLKGDKDGFEKTIKGNEINKPTLVTDRKIYRIDRLTGLIEEV